MAQNQLKVIKTSLIKFWNLYQNRYEIGIKIKTLMRKLVISLIEGRY